MEPYEYAKNIDDVMNSGRRRLEERVRSDGRESTNDVAHQKPEGAFIAHRLLLDNQVDSKHISDGSIYTTNVHVHS